jgi:hypothetical protein
VAPEAADACRRYDEAHHSELAYQAEPRDVIVD